MNEVQAVRKPDFGGSLQFPEASSNQGLAVSSREIARIQGEIFMAKQFPRNEERALKKIEAECSRSSLAEKAIYQYARGGTDITGPSIRLAEAVARAWGNIRYGFEVVDSKEGSSTVRAYSYDIETNVQAERTFDVPHVRYSKTKGIEELVDPRDIYETQANQAARRIRACLQETIPGDVIDFAVAKCQQTLEQNVKITAETPLKIAASFRVYGVSKAAIEAVIQRKLESLTTANYIRLTSIWQSIHDGIAKPEDFFDLSLTDEPAGTSQTVESPARQEAPKKVKPAKATKAEEVVEEPEVEEELPIEDEYISDEDASSFGF